MFLACALVVAGCWAGGGSTRSDPADQAAHLPGPEEHIESIYVPARWASAVASDIKTLGASSDAVFVGRVVRLKEQRDEQLVSDVSEGSAAPVEGKPVREPAVFPVSVYEVRVEQTIAGGQQPGAVVFIDQAGGVTERADGSFVRLGLEGDEPLAVGERYLFFARERDNGNLSVAPFARLLVTGHGLEPLASWSNLGAMQALSGRSIAEAASLIQAAGGR
jgi:hypothetical protein